MGRRAFRDGRPIPSGQVVDRLRVCLNNAIDELEDRKKPLHKLMADGFEKDPAKMLIAIRSLLPQDVNHNIADTTRLHLEAVRALSKAPALAGPTEVPVVIDVSPEGTLGPQNNVAQTSRAGEGARPLDD